MKKNWMVLMIAMVLLSPVLYADTTEIPPVDIYATFGPLRLPIPLQSLRLIALYDFVKKTPLAGAETVLGLLKVDKSSVDPWDIDLTAGFVTDEKAKGAPIIGANLAKQNPSGAWVSIDHLKLGIFVGYNANAGNGTSKPVMAGAKMAY